MGTEPRLYTVSLPAGAGASKTLTLGAGISWS